MGIFASVRMSAKWWLGFRCQAFVPAALVGKAAGSGKAQRKWLHLDNPAPSCFKKLRASEVSQCWILRHQPKQNWIDSINSMVTGWPSCWLSSLRTKCYEQKCFRMCLGSLHCFFLVSITTEDFDCPQAGHRKYLFWATAAAKQMHSYLYREYVLRKCRCLRKFSCLLLFRISWTFHWTWKAQGRASSSWETTRSLVVFFISLQETSQPQQTYPIKQTRSVDGNDINKSWSTTSYPSRCWPWLCYICLSR